MFRLSETIREAEISASCAFAKHTKAEQPSGDDNELSGTNKGPCGAHHEPSR